MKKNSLIIFLLGLYFINPLLAQYPNVKFEKIAHHFGDILETKGIVSYEFVYHNLGDVPVNITDVSVSCGCSKPEYELDTVFPGKTGSLKIKFDPKGRQGEFDYAIVVTFNNDRIGRKNLKIIGNVINDIKPISYKYSAQMGSSSFSNINLIFPNIKVKSESIKLFMSNDGKSPVNIISFEDIPKFMSVNSSLMTLKPGDTAIITLTVHAEKVKDLWGEFSNRINIITNDSIMPYKVFTYSFVKKPDFSHLTRKEKKNTPKISFSKLKIDYGSMKKGEKQTREITLTNNGKSELEIYKINAPCYCFKVDIEKIKIAPGETLTLKFTIDTLGKQSGNFSRGATFYTNDPDNFELTVYGVAVIQ